MKEEERAAYFNSIKVRLEQWFHFGALINISFQFHKGTIRTVSRPCGRFSYLQFQFHKGTIRT